MEGQGNVIQPPTLLDVNEAAAWCHMSINSLNYLRMHGRFAPAIRLGRRCYWKPEDLNAWIEAQRESVAA